MCYMFTSLANPAVVHRYVPSTSGRTNAKMLAIGHFTVMYLVARPLIWSEAEGDLVVIETCI